MSFLMAGVNLRNVCFGRKTKFFPESEDFARNRETWKISERREVTE